METSFTIIITNFYLTIRPAAWKGYWSIAHEAKPNGLLTRGPLRAKGLIVLASPI